MKAEENAKDVDVSGRAIAKQEQHATGMEDTDEKVESAKTENSKERRSTEEQGKEETPKIAHANIFKV